MSDNKPVKSQRVEILSVIFVTMALLMFFISLLGMDSPHVPKDQMIYWFIMALVAAFVPMIRQLRFGDIEVQLEGLKREVDEVGTSLDALRAEYRKGRNRVYEDVAGVLPLLSTDAKYELQRQLNQIHLNRLEVSTNELLEMLRAADCYDGHTDQITNEVVDAIESLQEKLRVHPVDGILGEITYNRLKAPPRKSPPLVEEPSSLAP